MNAGEEMGPDSSVDERSRLTLTPALIDHEMRVNNKTLDEIATEWGVTKSAVSYHRVRGGKYKKPNELAMEFLPWKDMDARFKKAKPYVHVTRHLQYVIAGPSEMSRDALYRLRLFYNKLMDDRCVLVFDPAIPPGHRASIGGWAFEPREAGDGDLIIRVNAYVSLTEEQHGLMRLPTKLPEV